MGKVVKTVLKVAAVAAIAYFAPPLAAKLGGSIGITSALGTTALSSGIGALAGKVTGVGAGTGAMIGGFAGAGKSGLFGSKAAGTAPAGAAGGMPSPDQIMSSTNASLAGNTAGMANLAPASAAGIASLAPGAAGGGGLGGALSSVGQQAGNVLKTGLQNVAAGAKSLVGGINTATGINLGPIAPTLLAAGIVGNPGAAMAKAQEAELARAQQVNAALTQQRLDQANQLISDTAYIDPEYMARQAAEDAMIRGGIQTAERTRGLTGERLAAERRRMALGTSRTAGSAYQQGFGTGVDARVRTRAAGISAIPTAFPMSDPSGALNAANAAAKQRAEQETGLSRMFGQALGVPETEPTKPKQLTFNLG